MSEAPEDHSPIGLLTLRDVRGYLVRSHCVGLAVFIGVLYALGSMLLGGMLTLAHVPGGYSVLFLWGNALGLQPWNYPGLFIVAPWGYVELPFFATISMVLVSAGVALGMAVALVLGYRLVKDRNAATSRPAATGTIVGLTPAMIALVTLGACCSTTAAATAGVGLVAQASGSSTSNLLLNNWFLGVFQMAVVYVALIAQELLLRVYGSLFAGSDPGFARASPPRRPFDRRALAAGAIRVGLVAAGVTWVLTVLADWTTVSPWTASPALWFNWLVEHGLVGGFAVFVALSPGVVRDLSRTFTATTRGVTARVALLLGAWTLGGWVPPPLSSAGVEGFGNELLGVLGYPSSVGAVTASFPWGSALLFQWIFQYLLLAGFAGVFALWPERTASWLEGPAPSPESKVPGPANAPAAAPPLTS